MPGGQDDPELQRRRLRSELRQARLDASLTQQQVATEMDWSTSKLIRIENGEVSISRNDLRALLALYGIRDRKRVDELIDVARVARERSWAEFSDVHSPAWLRYLGFESSAWLIRTFQPLLVPGLLQTEEYSAAVQATNPDASAERTARRWDVRARRQQLHERDSPPKMFFILGEAVVRQQVGGIRVMRRQLRELRAYNDLDHVTIRVLPFTGGAHFGLNGPFILLEFLSATDDPLLYLENAVELSTRDDPRLTSQYLQDFFDLERLALSWEDTNAFLDEVIAEMTEQDAQADTSAEG